MDRAHFQRLEALFSEAIELPPEAIDDFVTSKCGDDAHLAAQLRRMLRNDASATQAVEEALGTATDPDVNVGRIVGAYRVDSVLGVGAMGVVYRAARADGAYDQDVALKLVAGRLLDSEIRSRFLRERQVLASLDHPGIARLLDGGVTDDGVPYLVMEYVDGQALTDYCDQRRLGIRHRLALFEQVCDAVRHAHSNLIVHRDLKPAHILVDAQERPRLLDFGIAAVLDSAEPDDAGQQTELRRFTPQYASPEQVTGGRITTAADVYSLGLVLYELLAGVPPYQVTSGASDRERQLICETVPLLPSRALKDSSGLAETRGLNTVRRLDSDLDTIVMKAIRKEPERRYPSADALLADLIRYRQHLPISARPDTVGYRLRKFVRRNRVPVVISSIASLLLIIATVLSINFALHANQQAAIASAVVDFLTDDVLGRADPHDEPDRDILLRTVLDDAAASIGERFAEEPVIQATIRETLGNAYSGLGEFSTALDHYQTAHALRSEHLGSSDIDTLRARSNMMGALIDAGDYANASEALPALFETVREQYGENHELTLTTQKQLALVYDGLGDYDRALSAMRDAAAAHRRVLGEQHTDTLTVENDLALILTDGGEYTEAELLLNSVLERRREVLGTQHPDTLLSLASLGYLLTESGRYAEAEQRHRDAVAIAEEILGNEHPRTAAYLFLLSGALRSQENYADALAASSQALDIRRKTLDATHPETLMSVSMQGLLLQDLGRIDEAEALLRERYELGLESVGAEHPGTLIAATNLAKLLIDLDQPAAAEQLAADTVTVARDALPEGYWLLGAFLSNHGQALIANGQIEAARATLKEAAAVLGEALGPDHDRVLRVQTLLDQLDRQ